MKILHAPTNVANLGWLLARGQRVLGHEAELHVHRQPAFAFGYDRLTGIHEGGRRDRIRAALGYLDSILEQEWDVFHFYYHASLLPRDYGFAPFADLPLLAGLGARIFFHVVGCESRLPAISHAESSKRSHCLTCRSLQTCLEADKPGLLLPILEHARGVVTTGPHRDIYLPGVVTNRLPLPIDTQTVLPGAPQRDEPVIVHMPSNASIKGTDVIEAALDEARAAGARFSYRRIENTPHAEARRLLQEADILVDQLGGSMYATAAVEAMTMGRVVLTDIPDRFRQPYGEDVPLVPVTASTLSERVREVVADVTRRRELSEAAIEYVARHHALPSVVRRCVEIYERPAAPVPEGRTPAEIVADIRTHDAELRPALRAAMTAITVEGQAGTSDPPAGDGGAGGGGTAVATATMPVRAAAATATAAAAPATATATASRPAEVAPDPETDTDADEAPLEFPEQRVHRPSDDRPAHERFGETLEEYVDGRLRLGRRFYRRKLEEFGIPIGERVLDVGAGPGQWAAVIAHDHPRSRVVAADRNDYLLQCARRVRDTMGLTNLSVASADIYDLPFPERSFDTVLCVGVLQLVRVDDAMAELTRVLQPGGSLFLNVGGLGFYLSNCREAYRRGDRQIVKQNWKFVRNTIRRRDNEPFTAFTARRLRALGHRHGLRPLSATPVQLYPPRQATWHRLPVTLAALYRKA